MSYLSYLCSHTTHIVLCFGLVFLRLLYHMLPVSLDCSFVYDCLFSNVYLQNTKLTPLKTGVNSQLLFYIFGGNSNFTYMV
jgi:hypothetical protein